MSFVRGISGLFLLICGQFLDAGDWAQFLGPNRDGVSTETGLIDTFPATGPIEVWRAPLGVGMSGVAVSRGGVWTMYQDEQHQYLASFDAQTGQRRWATKLGNAFTNSMGNGPRATPTVDGKTVFVLSGDGVLAAVEFRTGNIRWQQDTIAVCGAKPAEYGLASSPLVHAGHVIVHVGAANGAVAAFDAQTGALSWTAGGEPSGYSSPVMRTLGGTEQIVSFCAASVMGIAPASGQVLWQYPFATDYDCNIACPIQLDDNSLLISAGENHGSVVLQLQQSAGNWQVEERWSSPGRKSVLRAEWQSPALLDGLVFGLDNVGSAGPITNLVCVDANSGKRHWIQNRFGKGNLTLADHKLFISTMKGELVIVTATVEGFHETARAAVLGMTRQAPVIVDGRLYLRDDRELVCLDVRENSLAVVD